MYQIDNSTTVSTIPASTPRGVPGFFTDGNPATGVSATILPAEFMNMLMMENLSVLASAGITPDKAKFNQLSLAIAKIVKDSAVGSASESVAGILKLSTTEQAIGAKDDSTAITPLKLYQKLANYLVQATEGAFGWLKIATQDLVNAGADDSTAVTPKKLSAAIQTQAMTAFTTAGTAPAFTLTPSPAIASYAANQRFRVKFSVSAVGGGTLNVSGIGPKSLKQYDPYGTKVAAIIAAGQLSDVEYDGVDMVVLDSLPAVVNNLVGLQGAAKNLAASATGADAFVSVTADEIILENSANAYVVARGVSLSPSLARSGAGGLDTGSSAENTWYSVWVIWNGETASGLFSVSATAPTMPSGYTHKARVGWIRTDATTNKYPLRFMQWGRRVQYLALAGTNVPAPRQMASGVSGSPTTPIWTIVYVSAFVPATASAISLGVAAPTSNSVTIVAPNATYGGASTANNPPFAAVTTPTSTSGSAQTVEMLLEGPRICWAGSGSGSAIYALGWEDNL